MSMSREQEKDFLEFWDYCSEIRNVAMARCIGCKRSEPVFSLYNQNMVLAYAATMWNARRKDMRAKAKKGGGKK